MFCGIHRQPPRGQSLRCAHRKLTSILILVIGELVNRRKTALGFLAGWPGHSPSSPTIRSRRHVTVVPTTFVGVTKPQSHAYRLRSELYRGSLPLAKLAETISDIMLGDTYELNCLLLASPVLICYHTRTLRVGLTPSPTCSLCKVVFPKGRCGQKGN